MCNRSPGPWFLRALCSITAAVITLSARGGGLLVDDFEDVSDWSHLTPETVTVKEGLGAGRWADTVSQMSVQKTFGAPLDLTDYTHLGFWLYSGVDNGAQLQLALDSEDTTSEGWDYFTSELTIDWVGWRWMWLSKDALRASRAPVGWHEINDIGLYAGGWNHTPREDTTLIFDRMVFAKAVVTDVSREQAWAAEDYVYTFTLELAEPYGSALGVDIACDAPSGVAVTVEPAHVDLPASGTASVTVIVTIPASTIAQGAYLTHELDFMVVAGSSGREEWRDIIANPPPPQSSPRMLLTSDDFVRMNAWAQTHAWAGSRRSSIISRADGWPDSFLTKYGLSAVALPPEGGQWSMHYVCPTHGVNLSYAPPMTHACPIDDETFTGWPYDQAIYARQHNDLAHAANDAALAYAFTEESSYAQDARTVLLLYAAAYNDYPIHDNDGNASGSGARVLASTLDESVWLIETAWAYDLIASSGVLSAEEKAAIERRLLLSCAELIMGHDAGLSNIQAWHNAAIAAAGRAIADPGLVAFALHGTSGFDRHMTDSVLSDGIWYEGSWGYHFYTLSPMTYLAEMGERGGFPLYRDAALKKMYTAPIQFAPPDLVLPAFNDAGTVDLRGSAGWRFEAAYRAYGEPALALPLLERARDEEALFWGVEALPDSAPSVTESHLFDAGGYAVLRGGTEVDPWYLALDYGPHGGWHGHYDKLGYVFFGRGAMLGLDPGSHSYALPLHDTWDRSTVAHNTVTVDETDQQEAIGSLQRFIDLPGCVFARASAGDVYAAADLTRDIVMVDGYVLDRIEARSRDAAQHRYDWLYHNPGDLSHDLTVTPYDELPGTGGYQHLSNNVAETTPDDARFDFVFPHDPVYPGGLWKNDDGIVASTAYSRQQAHSGDGSNKLHYDFSAVSGYITFRTKSMADYAEEVPTRISVWVYGANSQNRIRLRVVDATGESHVSPYTVLDFTGWREVAHDVEPSGSHWGGNDDGIIDLPLDNLVLELRNEDAGGDVGDVFADDWRLTFPLAGEVLVEDFERLAACERVWVKGAAGTTFVSGDGIGPELTVPVPYAMARRTGLDIDFDALHEPYGTAPEVTVFDVLSSSAPAADRAIGYRVESAEFRDRVMLVGAGPGGTTRGFDDHSTDGVLAWIRKDSMGRLTRLSLADGSAVADGTKQLLSSTKPLTAVAFQLATGSVQIVCYEGDLAGTRLYSPGTSAVTWEGVPAPFTQDGDYVLFGDLQEDADGDAMPDMWEIAHFGDLARSGQSDEDQDRRTNLEEYLSGTDPMDVTGNSKLAIRQAGERIDVSFTALAADGPGYGGLTRYYALERTSDPVAGPWRAVAAEFENIAGSGQPVVYSSAPSDLCASYRATIWLE